MLSSVCVNTHGQLVSHWPRSTASVFWFDFSHRYLHYFRVDFYRIICGGLYYFKFRFVGTVSLLTLATVVLSASSVLARPEM